MRSSRENPLSSSTKTALWAGAGVAAALGVYALVKSFTSQSVAPLPPPMPLFGQQPEILQAIGPYGVTPVVNA